MTSPNLAPCPQCGGRVNQAVGAVSRARIYCGRACAALGRRKNKTIDQKRAEKSAYDAAYRAANSASLKAKKAAFYQRTRDPEKEREKRKLTMSRHIEYCRQPKYREWKRGYDQSYRATKYYGQFGEAFLVLLNLEREIDARADSYELACQKGTVGKTQKRKRAYEQHQ